MGKAKQHKFHQSENFPGNSLPFVRLWFTFLFRAGGKPQNEMKLEMPSPLNAPRERKADGKMQYFIVCGTLTIPLLFGGGSCFVEICGVHFRCFLCSTL